jgi:hypothetical protein
MGELLFISNVRYWQNSPRGGKCRLDSPMLGRVVNEFLALREPPSWADSAGPTGLPAGHPRWGDGNTI